jgi:hypothetical protein
MRNSVAPRNINQGLASNPPCQCLLRLVCSELWLATEPHAPGLRSLSALTCPGQDEVALEFSQPAEDRLNL